MSKADVLLADEADVKLASVCLIKYSIWFYTAGAKITN